MKASMLGLMVASVAFGGSSVYLWRQLDEQRHRADAAELAVRSLSARIGQQQAARAANMQPRPDIDAGFASSEAAPLRVPRPASGITLEKGKADDAPPQMTPWTIQGHEPSPAMKRMMRANTRSFNRRMYADVGDALGLDKDTALKLVDLISDQQNSSFDHARESDDPTDATANWDDIHRQQEKAIADLIGPDKLLSLQQYQQTMPARQEFDMLSQQLASSDLPLTQDQSRKLLATYVTERARVPMPTYTEGADGADYNKAVNAWQADYAQRISDEANHILDADQLTAYNEIQQWQKEMREQMPTLPLPTGARGVVRGTRGAANSMWVEGVVVNEGVAPADQPRKQ
jgi:hypothetical protein